MVNKKALNILESGKTGLSHMHSWISIQHVPVKVFPSTFYHKTNKNNESIIKSFHHKEATTPWLKN